MKKMILAIALALSMASAAQAAPLVFVEAAGLAPQPQAARAAPASSLSAADLRVVQTAAVVVPPANMSELPEPEVFLMMLLGLCLIGYRASKHSDEKFE